MSANGACVMFKSAKIEVHSSAGCSLFLGTKSFQSFNKINKDFNDISISNVIRPVVYKQVHSETNTFREI